MSLRELLTQAKEFLSFELFTVSDVEINVATVFVFLMIILVSLILSWIIRHGVQRYFRMRGVGTEGTIAATNRLVHYAVVLIGLGIALDTIGINLNALFAAGAVFAVAIGFAMRNIVENFISGILLLVERVIKPGDVIDVEGQRVKIVEMRIRTTVARTRDGEDIIIPNAILVQSMVKNHTMRDTLHRVTVLVGVTYDSDMRHVRETLENVAERFEHRHAGSNVMIGITDFGDSSVVWRVMVWIDEPFDAVLVGTWLREAVWFALKDADITIAFPQLDVHFDKPVEDAITAMGH